MALPISFLRMSKPDLRCNYFGTFEFKPEEVLIARKAFRKKDKPRRL